MKNEINKSALESLLKNVRFLSQDVLKKILTVEKFTSPAIASFGMDSFSMNAPASYIS